MRKLQLIVCFLFLFISSNVTAQYKDFSLNQKGDTINATNNAGQKVGKWVIEVGELRGEPGSVEEGIYKKGEKHGYWRKYSTMGDLISVENYIYGGKAGLQQYFTWGLHSPSIQRFLRPRLSIPLQLLLHRKDLSMNFTRLPLCPLLKSRHHPSMGCDLEHLALGKR